MDNLYVTYQHQKLKEVILYILNKTGDISYYMLMKILFCVERVNLLKWGEQMTALNFYAREHGPVPSSLYHHICNQKVGKESRFDDVFLFVGEYNIHPQREADMQYLSQSDIESLDMGIEELLGKNYKEVEAYLHDEIYNRIVSAGGSKKYTQIDIAESGKASKVALDRIAYQQTLSRALL